MKTSKARPPIIRILLADDHPVVREGIRSAFKDYADLSIIAEAADGLQAVHLATTLKPHVVLMDINMPKLNGIEATRKILEKTPEVKVLALTIHESREYVIQLARCGASGYILKNTTPSELAEAIRKVHSGSSSFSSEVSAYVLDDYVQKAGKSGRPFSKALSPREKEVLISLARATSNKDIAQQLGIGLRTVETHRERIMKKLDIHTAAGLTAYAIETGLVDG